MCRRKTCCGGLKVLHLTTRIDPSAVAVQPSASPVARVIVLAGKACPSGRGIRLTGLIRLTTMAMGTSIEWHLIGTRECPRPTSSLFAFRVGLEGMFYLFLKVEEI